MKLRITTFCGLLALILGFMVISCGGDDEALPDGKLTSLKVGEYTQAPGIPTAITKDRWDTGLDLFSDPQTTLSFNNDGEDYTEDVRIKASVSSGARAEWGIGTRTSRPSEFFPTGVPATFYANDYIYIRVTSSDAYVVNYYRFFARIFSPVRELAGLTVAGRFADLAIPGVTPSDPALGTGVISITIPESLNAALEAETFDENAKVRFAVGLDSSTLDDLDFAPRTSVTVTDRERLWVEVTAQNTIDKYYYRFRIDVGRLTSIKLLECIGGTNGTTHYEVVGKGFPGSAWTGGSNLTRITVGSFASPHQPANGFKLYVDLDDPDASWEYAKILSPTNATQPTWLTYNDEQVRLENGEYLALKITPVNTNANALPGFYKVRIDLLAAEFTRHPAPAVYKLNATATPLSFDLDRDDTGYSYQWYEANSWYGGYGFDADGRIVGETGFSPDPTTPNNPPQPDAQYYVGGLDEKSNVSFHNGGNQYYRLPVPGRPISGATSKTFTPPTNKRPFIGGFSNVTNYYWVEAKAPNNLIATSKRAVIVTEHNAAWDLGVKGPDFAVEKNHFIVDMPNLKDKAGVAVPMRNPRVFTSFRQPYQIDLRGVLPDDFDIMDYSVATAWALFFLRDGTPWIQNWTQGNISFIDSNIRPTDDNPDAKVQDGDKEKLVLYYNLTNNNGTLGLNGDGKEPSGGSLDKPFTHVVIMPSGEKPMRQMPPLFPEFDNKPVRAGDAQGWFCGYIELVELRFEGPARPKAAE
jgi:hypothetical protein